MHEENQIELSVKNLSKQYEEVIAINNISFELHKGEFITLLGPSGSGKSTILMGIAGFLPLDSGAIYLKGKDVANLPPRQRNIGMVFQSYSLFPHMNVADNVGFPLRMRKYKKNIIKEKVRNILDKVQLQGFENRRIHQLSGGQQQRVALARALIYEPTLLLMDEPFGALDKKLREEMQYELKAIQKKFNITILFVTHDQSEALILSSRIAIVNQGNIVQMGSPIDLYHKPQSQFVSEFLGESNLIQGVLKDNGYFFFNKEQDLKIKTEMPPGEYKLLVRPEWIVIYPKDSTKEGLLAEVLDLTFLGDGFRYILKIGKNLKIVAKTSSSDTKYEVGNLVKLSFKENFPVFIPKQG